MTIDTPEVLILEREDSQTWTGRLACESYSTYRVILFSPDGIHSKRKQNQKLQEIVQFQVIPGTLWTHPYWGSNLYLIFSCVKPKKMLALAFCSTYRNHVNSSRSDSQAHQVGNWKEQDVRGGEFKMTETGKWILRFPSHPVSGKRAGEVPLVSKGPQLGPGPDPWLWPRNLRTGRHAAEFRMKVASLN